MMYYSIWLGLVIVAGAVLTIFITRTIGGKSAHYFMAQQKFVGRTEGVIEEMINGQKVKCNISTSALRTLKKNGLVKTPKEEYKAKAVIIATGKLEKKLTVKAVRFTKTAKEQIEALGGKTEVI